MDEIRVLVTHPFDSELIEKLTNVSPRLEIMQRDVDSYEQIADLMPGIDVMYGIRALPPPEEAATLKWVQLHFAGIDRLLDNPLYTDSDVIFTTASGIHSVTMAEYTLAGMLALSHHLPRMLEDKAAHNWPQDRWDRYVPRELRGATLGIIGYGSIGREIARLASALGMTVLAMKRDLRNLEEDGYTLPGTGDPEATIPERLYPPAARKSFLGACDYVVLTLPLTPDTYHFIDAEALSAMKDTAVLINISRGGVVDQAALVEALTNRTIGAAVLDVYEEEPLPEDSPLWDLPNALLSPHVSGFTPLYDARATDLFAENLRRYVVGEPLLNVVDRATDY